MSLKRVNNIEKLFREFKSIYCFTFYKYYYYDNQTNSKIIKFKSAFGNLGYLFKENILKSNVIINEEYVYIDRLKVDSPSLFLKLYYDYGRHPYFFFVGSKSSKNHEPEIGDFQNIVKTYFSDDFNIEKRKIFIKQYIKHYLDANFYPIVKFTSVIEEHFRIVNDVFIITNESAVEESVEILNEGDAIHFGFRKPYINVLAR